MPLNVEGYEIRDQDVRMYEQTSIVRAGLVLHLDASIFNTVTYGTTWFDLLANDNGNIINGASFDSSNGGSIAFDGVNDYINVPQPNLTFSPNRWTICFWIKPNNQYARFITPASNGIDQWIEYDSGNRRVNVQITESADVNNRSVIGNANSTPIGQWTHCCVVINNLNVKIYTNGNLDINSTQTISIGNWSSTWRIGQRGNSTSWYSGNMAMLKGYNRELSATEIAHNYNVTKGRFGL